MSIYRCPECLGPLSVQPGHLECCPCAQQYPILGGVPLLCLRRDFYYGEVPQDEMRAILSRAPDIGWRNALLEHADKCGKIDFYSYTCSELRAGARFLLTGFERGAVLDYGCGTGGLTMGLARNFPRVYATDFTPERAQFTQIRACQEHLHNVNVFCSGDTRHIPLADASIDVIVLNGVLEWVPESAPGKPRAVQLEFLKELRRVLTGDGVLFIGIENRAGVGYLLGKKEDHARLRFVSLLPRRIADWYSRFARGQPYRTYTYTRSGYRSLLRCAGFPAVEFFALIPNYREVYKAVRLSEKAMVRECLNAHTLAKRLRNALLRPLLPSVAESFGILAGRSAMEPYATEIVGHIAKSYFGGERLTTLRYSVTNKGVVTLQVVAGRTPYLVELPASADAEQRLEAAVQKMELVRGSIGPEADRLLLPRVVAWSAYRGQRFLLRGFVEGQDLCSLPRVTGAERFFSPICQYLALLCDLSRKPGPAWRDILLSSAGKYVLPLVMNYRRRRLRNPEQFEKRVFQLVELLKQTASDWSAGYHCAAHGDFWHANIVVDPHAARIVGVLDWDRFEPDRLPFLDLFHFMVMHHRHFGGLDWAESVVRLHKALCAESTGQDEAPLVRTYASQIGCDPRLAAEFLPLYWMHQGLHFLLQDFGQPALVLEKALHQPLDAVLNLG